MKKILSFHANRQRSLHASPYFYLDMRWNDMPRMDRSNINGYRDLNPGISKVGRRFLQRPRSQHISSSTDAMEKWVEIYADRLSRRDSKSDDESATCDWRSGCTIFDLFSELSRKIIVDVAPSDIGFNPLVGEDPRAKLNSRSGRVFFSNLISFWKKWIFFREFSRKILE